MHHGIANRAHLLEALQHDGGVDLQAQLRPVFRYLKEPQVLSKAEVLNALDDATGVSWHEGPQNI